MNMEPIQRLKTNIEWHGASIAILIALMKQYICHFPHVTIFRPSNKLEKKGGDSNENIG